MMPYNLPRTGLPRRALAAPLLFAAVAAGSIPMTATAQEQGYPRLVAPDGSAEWIRGMGSAELLSALTVEFVPVPGQPKFINQPGEPSYSACLLFVVSTEGEVSHLGRSPEPVEVNPGTGGAELCEGAVREARSRGGGNLLPGDMFFPGDAWLPEGFVLTSEMLAGGEVNGRDVLDEIVDAAARSRDGLVRSIGRRWAEGVRDTGEYVPAWAFVVALVPAEEEQEFAHIASAILLAGKRPRGMQD